MHAPTFFFNIYSGLDQCQGTVHGLSSGTDDILLKASVDPFISLSWGSNWGDGKRPQACRFLYNLSSYHAYKRTLQWGRNKDLWFSLARSLLAPLQSGCKVQHQSRCGVRNMTLDHWCGSGDWGGEGEQTQHYIKPLVRMKCWLWGGKCNFTVEPHRQHWCWSYDLHSGSFYWNEMHKKSLDYRICVKGEGWPNCGWRVTALLWPHCWLWIKGHVLSASHAIYSLLPLHLMTWTMQVEIMQITFPWKSPSLKCEMWACMFVQRCLFSPCGGVSLEVIGLQ